MSKLKKFSEEIAKLERSVKRRVNQLEKAGETSDVEIPERKKPHTVKQAKEIIFKMESYLRQTSPNEGIRKAAEIGGKIKERKAVEKTYKSANKMKKLANKAFVDFYKNPVNKERKEKGLQPLSFGNILEEFTIGASPNEVKDSRIRGEWSKRNQEREFFLKNNPKNAGKLYIENMINELRREAISQLSKGLHDELNDAMDKILNMSDTDFLLFYEENKGAFEVLRYKYPDKASHWGEIQSLTDSIMESLGEGERDEFDDEY